VVDINQLANQPFLHRSSTIKDSRLTAVFTMSLTMRASLLRFIREQGRFLCQVIVAVTCAPPHHVAFMFISGVL
jgi:hypothetical protein